MEFKEIQKIALEVRDEYAKLNERKGERKWGALEHTQGLAADVGDLNRLVMAKSGLRCGEDLDEKLLHQISDCLWSVMVVADELGINLETEFVRQMKILEERVKNS